jgi:hypothetical protein
MQVLRSVIYLAPMSLRGLVISFPLSPSVRSASFIEFENHFSIPLRRRTRRSCTALCLLLSCRAEG